MKTNIALALTFCGAILCNASGVSVTLTPNPTNVVLGSHKILSTIQFISQDDQSNRFSAVWTFDYNPTSCFKTITDTNSEGAGYSYFGRLLDYSLFTDWRMTDDQGNVIGTGVVILPNYPETMMAKIMFTNVVIGLRASQSNFFNLSATLLTDLSSDALRGLLSGDQVRAFLSVVEVNSLEGDPVAVDLVNNQSIMDYSVISRPSYSTIASFKPVGDDMVITAYVEPGKSYALTSRESLGLNSSTNWGYGGSETILSSQNGELFFAVPFADVKSNQQRYYSLVSVEEPDKTWGVQIEIILPGETNGPVCPKPGKVDLQSKIRVIDERLVTEYQWISDTGETGSDQNFSPTFAVGVHWVKLHTRGAATDAYAFKWIIVRP